MRTEDSIRGLTREDLLDAFLVVTNFRARLVDSGRSATHLCGLASRLRAAAGLKTAPTRPLDAATRATTAPPVRLTAVSL